VSFKLVLIYFVLGGITVSAITYFGSQGKSQVAAFVAFLPSTSLITLCTIYLSSGTQPAVSYAKSMLILLPPWVLYVAAIIFLLPRIGLPLTIAISVAVYLVFALLIMKLVP
jgi:uncharacterized membrane protein (GlpM family)